MNTISNLRLMAQHLVVASTIAAAPVVLATLAYAEQPATAAGQTKQAPTMTDAEDPMGADVKGADSPAARPDAAAPSTAAGSKAAAGQAAAPSTKDVVVGAAVFGSDGKKVGEIKGVKSEPSGSIQEIHVKTGGFLGLGGKIVVIPGNKIAKGGESIQLALTTEEVSKMPPLAEKQG